MHEARYRRLLEEIREEFPDFRMIQKHESRFQKLLHYTLVVLTFGRMRRYLDDYQTTIGRTVYVTQDWDERDARDRYITLCHERVHMRQFARYTLVGMGMLYLLLPLPAFVAYFRARFEREAYAESIRRAAEVYGLEHVREVGYRDGIVSQFLGSSYGWMWPYRRSMDAWYDRILASLESAALEDETLGRDMTGQDMRKGSTR